MDTGLLILRVVVGALFVVHGTQKLFGWFGGHGLQGAGGFFETLGYRPGRRFAALAGLTESGAGLLLVAGFLTPLASAAIIGVMINAYFSAKKDMGLVGGYEIDLVMATVASALAFAGPGTYSVDSLLGWTISGATWGLASLALSIGTATLVLSTRRPAPEPAVEDGSQAA
jgi:putative oxidoreductase